MLWQTRVSIARLMGVVVVAAVTFAALRYPTEHSAGAMLLFTGGALMIAVAGALCRSREERPWWLGFALFGGGYLALAQSMAYCDKPLPTITLVGVLSEDLGLKLDPSSALRVLGWNGLSPAHRILHCAWALALGALGWLLSGALIGAPSAPVADATERSVPRSLRWSAKWSIVIGLAAFWIAAISAVVAHWPAPGVWAGMAFLLTCGLLGIAALGAAFGRGRDRETRLGAVLFGFGYLALTFGKSSLFIVAPHLPTESLVNSFLRPGGPSVSSELPDFTTTGYSRVRHEIMLRKLDARMPFHFPEPTPLIDVLNHVKNATREPNFPGIPIYVDPDGLANAGSTLQSPVHLDSDRITLSDGLRLCLKQLALGFALRDGIITISDEGTATIPVYEDPVQIVGHSLLALFAAALGAVAVPFVLDRPRSRQGSSS